MSFIGLFLKSKNILVLLFLQLSIVCAAEKKEWYSDQKELYHGIPCMIHFTPFDEKIAEKSWGILQKIDGVYNDYAEESEVARLNVIAKGKEFILSDDLKEAFDIAEKLYDETDGAFDICARPVRNLWKQAEKNQIIPTAESIKKAAALTGRFAYTRNGNKIYKKDKGVCFDFGGMAKGLAVDRLMAFLIKNKRTAALVQVGGETACFGISKKLRTHRLAIPHPKSPEDFWAIIVDKGDGLSGCTSGNYRQPLSINGKKYYHILDSKIGKPASTQVLSVSVLMSGTGHNAWCDGLSTAGVVMGVDKFLLNSKKHGIEASVLSLDKKKIIEKKTKNWSSYVIWSFQ